MADSESIAPNRGIPVPAIDAERHQVAHDATFEVQILAEALREKLNALSDGDAAVMARGILTRVIELADIVFEAVVQSESERESVDTLLKRLGGTCSYGG